MPTARRAPATYQATGATGLSAPASRARSPVASGRGCLIARRRKSGLMRSSLLPHERLSSDLSG